MSDEAIMVMRIQPRGFQTAHVYTTGAVPPLCLGTRLAKLKHEATDTRLHTPHEQQEITERARAAAMCPSCVAVMDWFGVRLE